MKGVPEKNLHLPFHICTCHFIFQPIFSKQIKIPEYLMVKEYPHFLEQKRSYHSTSLLGKIYDQSKLHQSETVPPISKLLFLAASCYFSSLCNSVFSLITHIHVFWNRSHFLHALAGYLFGGHAL